MAFKVDKVAGQRRRPTHTDSGHPPTASRGSGKRPAPSRGSPFSLLQGHRRRGLSAARVPSWRRGRLRCSRGPGSAKLLQHNSAAWGLRSLRPAVPSGPAAGEGHVDGRAEDARVTAAGGRAGEGSGPRLRRSDPALGRRRARSPAALPSATQAPLREAAPTPRLAPQPRPRPRVPWCLTCAPPSVPPRRPRAPRRGTRPPGRR